MEGIENYSSGYTKIIKYEELNPEFVVGYLRASDKKWLDNDGNGNAVLQIFDGGDADREIRRLRAKCKMKDMEIIRLKNSLNTAMSGLEVNVQRRVPKKGLFGRTKGPDYEPPEGGSK